VHICSFKELWINYRRTKGGHAVIKQDVEEDGSWCSFLAVGTLQKNEWMMIMHFVLEGGLFVWHKSQDYMLKTVLFYPLPSL